MYISKLYPLWKRVTILKKSCNKLLANFGTVDGYNDIVTRLGSWVSAVSIVQGKQVIQGHTAYSDQGGGSYPLKVT